MRPAGDPILAKWMGVSGQGWPKSKPVEPLPKLTDQKDTEPCEAAFLQGAYDLKGALPLSQAVQGSLHEKHRSNIATCKWCCFTLFWWKKQHVSNGCKMYLLRSPAVAALFSLATAKLPKARALRDPDSFLRSFFR